MELYSLIEDIMKRKDLSDRQKGYKIKALIKIHDRAEKRIGQARRNVIRFMDRDRE